VLSLRVFVAAVSNRAVRSLASFSHTTEMAVALRTSSSKVAATRKVQRASRSTVRPVAAMNAQKAAASLAVAGGLAALAAAPAEAANVISTVASAAEGYPFVPPAWAPSVFVPLTGLVLPAVAMASLFVYIQKEAPSK